MDTKMATKWKNQKKIPGLWPVSSEMTYMIHKSLHIDGMQTASYKHTYHQIIKHRSKFKLSNHTHNITDINLRTHIIDIYMETKLVFTCIGGFSFFSLLIEWTSLPSITFHQGFVIEAGLAFLVRRNKPHPKNTETNTIYRIATARSIHLACNSHTRKSYKQSIYSTQFHTTYVNLPPIWTS